MVLTCSPQHEGGPLRFPSPTHLHHLDATSTLIKLRRSLSRSPSKSPAFRLVTAKANSPSHNSPLSPSPLTPHRHASKLQLPDVSPMADGDETQPYKSPLGIDVPVAPRANTRAQTRRFSPLRSVTRPYAVGRIPVTRRVLAESGDTGNAPPGRSAELPVTAGVENVPVARGQTVSVVQPPKVDFKGFGQPANENTPNLQSPHSSQQHPFTLRPERHNIHLDDIPVKSSPLKRPDAPMKTDPSGDSSPSAKRRSLHGTSDFDIFDQALSSQLAATSQNSPGFTPTIKFDTPHAPASAMKRSNSLRKSTIQQRNERSANRTRGNNGLSVEVNTPVPPAAATAARKAFESRSPFPVRRNLFSTDQVEGSGSTGAGEPSVEPMRAPQRHPLSRTITQSSSGSDVAQDSPTHVPPRVPEIRRYQGTFAKSLPIGIGRNAALARQEGSGAEAGNVATPESFKDAKPLQAAFQSTGLISKRTKILQDEATEKATMPDTPCKRPMLPIPLPIGMTPAPASRPVQLKRNQHSFGAPSSPYNATTSKPTPVAMGKGVSIFGSTIKPLNRRGSFLGADDGYLTPGSSSLNQSFDAPSVASDDIGDQSSNLQIGEFNPRNTIFAPQLQERAVVADETDDLLDSPKPEAQCQLILNSPDGQKIDPDGDCSMEDSPSAHRRFNSLGAISSRSGNGRPTILGDDHSPSPTPQKKSYTLPHLRSRGSTNRLSTMGPASPLFERREIRLPRTPKDGNAPMAPPDPSRLSISGHAPQFIDLRQSQFGFSVGFGSPMPPPATPTANRESTRFQSHRATQTTAHEAAVAELDSSLTSRFGQIEMIGEGEFSSVFKVANKGDDTTASGDDESYRPDFNGDSESTEAQPVRVWAVKKSRKTYTGLKDRARKMREVEILKALGRSSHTVQLEDHWEHEGHLYIQTDYCEGGSLDKFLVDTGRNIRLDDFRTWKILLDMTLGLHHIHQSSFIHLDMKPANVLITADGNLKIADFGLAAPWPAGPGIEEGDREYISPENLQGRFDKPSDVFSLGLIMLEIAGNVILPENGASWVRLRTNDFADVPCLTSDDQVRAVCRDASGQPIEGGDANANTQMDFEQDSSLNAAKTLSARTNPPAFMDSAKDPNSLDNMVKWMLNQEPEKRPTVEELLLSVGLDWTSKRRRTGTTVYEGMWGPADKDLAADSEMMDL